MNINSSYISYLFTKTGLEAARLLPKGILHALIDNTLRVAGYRSEVIQKNLNLLTKSHYIQDATEIQKLFYNNLASVTVSQVHGAMGGAYSYNNFELITEMAKKSGAVLLLGSHYGCWESAGKNLTPLLPELKQYVVYKRIKNRYVDEYLKKRRSDTVATIIEMKQVHRTVLKNLKSNIPCAYYFIADQYPSAPKYGIETTFLDQKTLFANGPEKLVKKLGLSAVFMDTKINRGKVEIDMIPLKSDESIIKQYADLLARQIERAPQYWLWSHKRWKNLDIY